MKLPLLTLSTICCLFAAAVDRACSSATSFQEPPTWSVGEANSTHQQWDASVAAFATTNQETPPSSNTSNPSITTGPVMTVAAPGFSASSGGYYAFDGPYDVTAEIANHGGPGGTSGSLPDGAGTRVLVQTAATLNTDLDMGVDPEKLRIVTPDGMSLPGGANEDVLRTELLFRGDVETPFGIVPQEELLLEFWLPDYAGDFQVVINVAVHSSFQHLRVDSLVEAGPTQSADFNQDSHVDGADFLAWQRGYGLTGDAATLAAGDANGDQQVMGDDLTLWQGAFARGASGVNAVAVVGGVPEVSGFALSLAGLATSLLSWRLRKRC